VLVLQAGEETLAREGTQAAIAGLEADRHSCRAAKALFEVGPVARFKFDSR
jgi:hypothetical protein